MYWKFIIVEIYISDWIWFMKFYSYQYYTNTELNFSKTSIKVVVYSLLKRIYYIKKYAILTNIKSVWIYST